MAEKSPLVIVLMGVSGSGKSTVGAELSRALGWPFRDADSFHPAANVEKMSHGVSLTDEDRAPWLAAIAQWIDERRRLSDPGIVSCSALKRAYRRQIIDGREGVRLVYLRGDKELIAERMRARTGHFMPVSLLDNQFATLEQPRNDEAPLIVSIAPPQQQLAAAIIQALGLEARREGAGA
jgi:carbohydrate kinase (thermoresistant glucokinase family)